MKKFLMKLFVLGTTCCSLLATEVKVCFTPAMNCREEIINAINTAQAEILIQSYMFTDPDLADALIKRISVQLMCLSFMIKGTLANPPIKSAC